MNRTPSFGYTRLPRPVHVVGGVVVPQAGFDLEDTVRYITVYDGPWGYFITKSRTRQAQLYAEAGFLLHHEVKPLYRINIRRKQHT